MYVNQKKCVGGANFLCVNLKKREGKKRGLLIRDLGDSIFVKIRNL